MLSEDPPFHWLVGQENMWQQFLALFPPSGAGHRLKSHSTYHGDHRFQREVRLLITAIQGSGGKAIARSHRVPSTVGIVHRSISAYAKGLSVDCARSKIAPDSSIWRDNGDSQEEAMFGLL